MSDESKYVFVKHDEEKKLVKFYIDIIEGNYQPSTASQVAFMQQLLNTKIAQLDAKTSASKRIHYFLRIGVMVLSGISTVILGFKFSGAGWLASNFSNVALIITALVTFMSTLAVFWDIENYWVRNKIMLNKLKELRYEFAFFVEGKTGTNAELKTFLDKFLLVHGDEYWEKYFSSLSKKKDNADDDVVK